LSWLAAGVPPADVAERAGNSVKVLLTVYAKCLDAGVLNRVEVEQGRDVLRRGDPLDCEVLSGGVVALTLDVCLPRVGAGSGRGARVVAALRHRDQGQPQRR